MNLRCFIAIVTPDSLKKQIIEMTDLLKKYDADIKWVNPENIHLTLKFLGNTPQSFLTKINETLNEAVLPYSPFYIKIYGTGVFPNKKHPRVIWIGIKDSEILINLRNAIEQSISSLGYQKDEKEFKPHLTIGRVRSQKGIMHIINNLEDFKDKDFGSIYVDNIKLMKSDLKPKGAEYSCLYDIPIIRRKNDE
ncbi:MAG: RNA 2',3'-cyclic phosphodiesterase [Nitrospirae bacterium]|nr:RNA 2',3'-cyclic phosphodiesterase [Nitrospirota bacterium]